MAQPPAASDIDPCWHGYFDALHQMTHFLPAPLDPTQQDQLKRLYRLVMEGNEVMNLTRITELEGFWLRHILDSLSVVPKMVGVSDAKIADIGSGAGFPTLPLAIVCPSYSYTAIESVKKKAAFIAQAAEALGLPRVSVCDERVEVLGQAEAYRGMYDVVVSRAVAPLPVLLEYALPLLKVGGQALFYKSVNNLASELDAAPDRLLAVSKMLGGGPLSVHNPALAGLADHRIVTVHKVAQTAAKFPRKPGVPAKKPLSKR
ncbi:MAG: 16S rRNA (guanine(527)-N(7))-methyltransferase RsmG [Cyanobacteria bacterium HKST-UBA06]|nr:16S rRNA (guanine(527)-N(7))-methyltransferase RsmG [Cyanobacteria bacterium HKST-UBA04]MCA9807638.1 16S rRNA (guanine(527)-N(7))-methyltransferase RsmG [Cyanobacteria bacterium HKST-UBA06]